MATNQVIHGSNRVVENPNRYKLNAVSGQANTYDLEKVPGVITDNGTPYSKAVLDKIDNVLSYLTPSVEKVGTTTPAQIGYYLEMPSSISGKTINTIMKNMINADTIPVTFNSTGYNSNGFQYYAGSQRYYNTIYAMKGTTTYVGVSTINEVLKDQDINNKFIVQSYQSSSYDINIVFDLRNRANVKLKYNIEKFDTMTFETSTNGTNWTYLADVVNHTDTTINIPDNCYLRINSPISIHIYKFEFLIDGFVTIYQNQFTLDNNGNVFTNNQRVLIDTTYYGTKLGNIFGNVSSENTYSAQTNYTNETCTILGDNTTSKISFNINSFYNGSTGVNSISKTDLNALFSSNTKVDNKGFNLNPTYNSYIKFNLSDITSCKLALWTYTTNTTIYTSDNDIDYVELHHLSSSEVEKDFEIDIPTNTKYIKVECNTSYGGTNCDIMYIYLKDIEYHGLIEKFDDISSNTLNGVDIPTLLKPSTKYELIYDEINNKFNFGNLTEKKPLFDITIEQSVRQVDLTGIYEKLEYGKLYALIVSVPSGANESFYFGNNTGGYVANNQFVSLTLFLKSQLSNYISIYYPVGHGTSSTYRTSSSNLSGYENIRFDSANFAVGSRIIIKEVA